MTPRPNLLGWAVLGAAGFAFFWALRRAVAAPTEEAWIKANIVRQGIHEVLWKASTDDHVDTSGPPTHYDVENNAFVWGNVSHPAVKIWGYR